MKVINTLCIGHSHRLQAIAAGLILALAVGWSLNTPLAQSGDARTIFEQAFKLYQARLMMVPPSWGDAGLTCRQAAAAGIFEGATADHAARFASSSRTICSRATRGQMWERI